MPELTQLLPHRGQMVLLDEVLDWDAERIRCLAHSHHRPDNPLRDGGQLSIYAGIEYAAQAMAAHAGLSATGDGPARRGYVATVSKLRAHTARLDDQPAPLCIEARRLVANDESSLYRFELGAQGEPLLSGQLLVVLAR